jgi:hypothetical protein
MQLSIKKISSHSAVPEYVTLQENIAPSHKTVLSMIDGVDSTTQNQPRKIPAPHQERPPLIRIKLLYRHLIMPRWTAITHKGATIRKGTILKPRTYNSNIINKVLTAGEP